jgi:hypothetical protein
MRLMMLDCESSDDDDEWKPGRGESPPTVSTIVLSRVIFDQMKARYREQSNNNNNNLIFVCLFILGVAISN